MRKICVLLLIATGTVLSASAQPFQKGDKLLGGSLGFGFNKSSYTSNPTYPGNDSKYVSVLVSPSIGFFTKPNRLSGFSLQYSYSSDFSGNNDFKNHYSTYGAGFYQQYWNDLGKSFYFIIEGKTGINYNDYFNGYASSPQNTRSKGVDAYLAIAPGFAYRIKKRLVLDVYYPNFLLADLGYSRRTYNGTEVAKSVGFTANTGLRNFNLNDFIFGFRYLL